MADKPQVLRETDDEARQLARVLVRGARYMAIAVVDPQTGYPSASRVLTATDLDGVPVILVSGLSAHTKALLADRRCSLLAGEPAKGDPLAHPRITLQCDAETVSRTDAAHDRIRQRFLDRHPKAELYVDFPDFRFFRLMPVTASLNGGFGRAYALPGADLVIKEPTCVEEWLELQKRLKTMTNEANDFADKVGAKKERRWRFGGVDPAGLDLVAGDIQLRHEFERVFSSPRDVMDYMSKPAAVE
ncbi:HugZ family protein [Neorhizobium lilium]|uniref:HugZ family protein n=1 Tax=Neorhizobium lilium TaxID=2503024 RepID=A0A444LI27_9HYPH|nr:pyridoxamine 5'-phosphate oxidase family protein [Neorhizobium lilium]RWX78686.1 HugZ family protein [Neorhizobium lilium]